MNSINFKHSVIFFNLCILISPINQSPGNILIISCLFLILIIGISHGALDDLKGGKEWRTSLESWWKGGGIKPT